MPVRLLYGSRTGPVPYGEQQLTYKDAIGAVVGALYLRDSWPGIPMGLVELQAGHPDRFVLLNQLASGRDACESWPAEPNPTYPFPDRVEGLPATLTISITGDPSTPYDAGVHLAETLGGGLLTVDGEQHPIAALGSNPCVNDAVADYLTTVATPSADTRCTL